ncbi:MAG: sugar phosphorylase [Anaerolineae bacterium]|nr:sugar phosphorylase [Anaerolineae bacterium]
MCETAQARIVEQLKFLYGESTALQIWPELQGRLAAFTARNPQLLQGVPDPANRLTERDVVLITYGDQVREPGKPPLQSLFEVLGSTVSNVITTVHILPFFPYSSDDGFSVIDYLAVNPELGSWEHIRNFRQGFKLMFDCVINHISSQSAWFKAFLAGDPDFENAFIVVPPDTDLSDVVRPRALPLLTPVETTSGEKLVWTTFSADQIDLNFADPSLLLRFIDVLLRYIEEGAVIIRLDAIAYLWKRTGTSCIHLAETHHVVKLFRAILDRVAPAVMLITETNVPHQENISYFGSGTDEAQMVYQFSLPPLVFHAIVSGNATYLSRWAADLDVPTAQTTFYNFLASHDGIGVRPVEGILPPAEVERLIEQTTAHKGHISYKTNSDGSKSAYELNISYFNALVFPDSSSSLIEEQVNRFMVSQAIMLSLKGVPAIYIHSLFGSQNYYAGVTQTGRYRSINREKFDRAALEAELADPNSLRARIFSAYYHLLAERRQHLAFHPNSPQEILDLHPALFIVKRVSLDGKETIICVHNVSDASQAVRLGALPANAAVMHDVLAKISYPVSEGQLTLEVQPYQVLWLIAE